MKKRYRVPLVWQMWGAVYVDAETAEEAINYALGPNCSLPEGNYIDDSVMLDDEGMVEVYPNRRGDEV